MTTRARPRRQPTRGYYLGAQHKERHSEPAFWSVSADKIVGIDLLLDPSKHQVSQQWHPELWVKRVMAVVVDSVLLVSIYAPNDRREREHLFGQMRK